MPLWRSAGSTAALALVNLNVATCRSPSETSGAEPAPREEAKSVELPGIDTSNLTPREKRDFSAYVSELLAPCADQPVSVAVCVKEARPCSLCLPAARFLAGRVTRGSTRTQVEQAYRIRFSPDQVKTVDPGAAPWKGAKDPTVTVVEWADFQCPYCAAASPVLDQLVEQYPDHVRLVFKQYPLSSHEHAEKAARAAVAAGRQGKFWEMHHLLFESQESGLDRPELLGLGKRLALDEKQFVADLDSEAIADVVAADRKQAEKLDFRGTPTLYVNGRHFDIELFNLLEDLNPWVELEIEQRTGKAVAPRAVASAAPAGATPSARPAPSGSAPRPGGSASP